MTDPTRKNLIQRCAGVMASVDHVPKRGHNDHFGYDYATEADIADAVRAEMARQELMLIPSVEKAEWREVPGKSGPQKVLTLTIRYKLTDGVESIEFVMLGEGADQGDKASYKAMTGATKYALLKLFLISTGDDPEAEEGSPPPPARGSRPAAPRPAAPAGDVAIKFGKGKDKNLSALSDDDVRWYIGVWEKDLGDPEKAKYHAKSRENIATAQAILAARVKPDGSPASKWDRVRALAPKLTDETLKIIVRDATGKTSAGALEDLDFPAIATAVAAYLDGADLQY